MEGLAYIRSSAVVLSVILMAALIGFFGLPLVQQIPALARDVLKSLADTEAMVASRTSNLYASQGVGALIAAFLAAAMTSWNKQRMLLLGQISFVLAIIALGLTTRINIALLLLVFIGWGSVTQLVMMNTLVQTEVPNNLRGRVFSVYFWALQGVAPFGSIVIGWMAQTWKVPVAAIVAGTICLLGILLIRFTLRNGKKSSA
jgi:predicted MFS family arabinose efflux permease